MENPFDNTLTNETEGKSKRPQFLTVLCVLSFICCGLLFVSSIYNLIMNTPEHMAENFEKMREFSPATAQHMEAQYAEQQSTTLGKIQPYLNILFILVSFLGVFQMFNLKKTGFYIYTAAELIPYIFMIIGGEQTLAMMGSMGGKAAGLTILAVMILFDVAFIVMYALNLKHMKN